MCQLGKQVAALTNLIQSGHPVEAMEQFYADDVIMQENETPPHIGKTVCLEPERRLLASVVAVDIRLINQAIDETNGVVFSEWQFESTDDTGQRYVLTEISAQQWRNELIQSEKFYYSKILMVK